LQRSPKKQGLKRFYPRPPSITEIVLQRSPKEQGLKRGNVFDYDPKHKIMIADLKYLELGLLDEIESNVEIL